MAASFLLAVGSQKKTIIGPFAVAGQHPARFLLAPGFA
jgi:hypothetical protein